MQISKPRHKAYVFLLAVAAIWGSAGSVIKFTLEGIDPLPFLAYRFLIAGIISFLIFLFKFLKGKKFHRFKANIYLVTLYGLLAVPIALGSLFVGVDNSTVLELTLVSMIGPLLVTYGAYTFYHEHITKREKRGIVIVIIGLVVSSILPIFLRGNDYSVTGNIFLIIYLIADSISILIAKELVRLKVKPANFSNFAFILGALTITPIAIYNLGFGNFVNTVVTLPLKYHLGVWYMAVISGTIAYVLFNRAQKTIELSEAVLFTYLMPVFSVFLAVFWLGESITIDFVIGAVIIIIGIYIAETKSKKRL